MVSNGNRKRDCTLRPYAQRRDGEKLKSARHATPPLAKKSPRSVDEARAEISGPCRSVPERRTDPRCAGTVLHRHRFHVLNHSVRHEKTKGGKGRVFHPYLFSAALFCWHFTYPFAADPACVLGCLLTWPTALVMPISQGQRFVLKPPSKSPRHIGWSAHRRECSARKHYVDGANSFAQRKSPYVQREADCRVKFEKNAPLLSDKRACPRVNPQAHLDAHARTAMPSLSPPSRSLCASSSRRAWRLLIAVAALAALAALPRVNAATTTTAPAAVTAAPSRDAAPATPSTPSTPSKAAKGPGPTCQSIMRRLSGSLAGTPTNSDKPGAVLVDVDKAGVTMACSHSDSIAIPVPGGSNPAPGPNTKTR